MSYGAIAHRLIGRYLYAGLYERARAPEFVAQRGRLRANCRLTPQQIADQQSTKLAKLLRHAYAEVPYYRQVFDERGLQPADIQGVEDLQRLPLLTRQDLQRERDCLKARTLPGEHGKSTVDHTGGSTGEPVTFFHDERYRSVMLANLERCFNWCGWNAGEPRAFLWGSDYDAQVHQTVRGRFFDWLSNRSYLNTFDVGEAESLAFATGLRALESPLLVGYASSLVLMAELLREHAVDAVRPKAVQSSAEMLTPVQREVIESTFDCKVFDRYGCREAGNIAHECSAHAGLHVLSDVNLVEVIRDGRAAGLGEEGLIAITNLDNYAMPLIRYVVGDVGSWASRECECGLPFPLLEGIRGRVSDIITAPSGRLIHGEFFTHLFYQIEGIRQFQVVQETVQELTIRVVPGFGFDPTRLDHLRDTIHRQADPDFHVDFHVVDQIEVTPSGKRRFTISKVPIRLGSEARTG